MKNRTTAKDWRDAEAIVGKAPKPRRQTPSGTLDCKHVVTVTPGQITTFQREDSVYVDCRHGCGRRLVVSMKNLPQTRMAR